MSATEYEKVDKQELAALREAAATQDDIDALRFAREIVQGHNANVAEMATLRAKVAKLEPLADRLQAGLTEADNDCEALLAQVESLQASFDESMRSRVVIEQSLNDAIAKLEALRPLHPQCAMCDHPAACMGSYEGNRPWDYACSACCGHGNEDGVCYPLGEIPSRYQALVTRIAVLEEAATPSLPPPAEAIKRAHCVEHAGWRSDCMECIGAEFGLSLDDQLRLVGIPVKP